MEFYNGCLCKVSFLEKVFLGLAFFAAFFLLGLFYFAHKIALAVTMQPGLVFVDTQIFGNIFLVKLKARVNKKTRKIGSQKRNDQKYNSNAVEHAAKVRAGAQKWKLDWFICASWIANPRKCSPGL